jgi:hypothetical protein
MISFLSRCWKSVASIVGIVAIIGGILALPTYIVTPADMKSLETKVDGKIQEFKKSMELDRNINRLNQVNDTLMKAKIQQRQYPKDKDIYEDVELLKKDKAILEQKIKG